MYTLIELWTPKEKYLALSQAEREEFFARVVERADVAGLARGEELVTLGMGPTEPMLMCSAHSWMAVWQGPDRETIDGFMQRIYDAGWWDYFDQEVAVGKLLPFEDAIRGQIEI